MRRGGSAICTQRHPISLSPPLPCRRFDKWQFECEYDIGESAVKWKTIEQLGVDLDKVELRYGEHAGKASLRQEIAKQYPGFSEDDVLVTSGGSEAIFSIYAALCVPGDHMVCETPNYPSNYGIPQGLGMETSLCSMDFEDGCAPPPIPSAPPAACRLSAPPDC